MDETNPRDQRPDGAAGPPAIALTGINKYFGPVHANRDIDLTIERGTIHGIVGENGAGKSTLMSILYGFYTADSGEIRVGGKRVHITDSRHALSLGIGMVHQHFMLVDRFSVLENVVLGAEDGLLLGRALGKARKALTRLAKDYGLEVDPDALIEDLSVGQQQRVEILKALYRGADALILDEPTGVLTPAEAWHLFRVLESLRAEGKTVILITHKLKEIMAITDNVSVMRQGRMVATLATKDTNPEQLAELMVGRRLLLGAKKPATPAAAGATLLDIDRLVVADDLGVVRVKSVSFAVKAGEVVGIAGVAGNGQSELLEAISGMRAPRSGNVAVLGKAVIFRGDRPPPLRKMGLAHVPEDRLRMGLVSQFSAWQSAILGYQDAARYGQGPFLSATSARQETKTRMEKYDIRPRNVDLLTAAFSGGNQQKIVIARELEGSPDVLIVGQPTRGVDIGAVLFIHSQVLAMRDAGKAVLLVSVELDEILALSDRVLVMFDGTIVGEADPSTTVEATLGLMMTGAQPAAEAADDAGPASALGEAVAP